MDNATMPAPATQERPVKTPSGGWTAAHILPGLALCLVVTGMALAMERGEAAAFGATWLEALVLAGLWSAGVVPSAVLAPAATAANALTIISMAALGLGTDLRTVAGAGPRVIAAVIGSLMVLGGISLLLIRLLAIG